jgi:PAS domain S-box-containing protein
MLEKRNNIKDIIDIDNIEKYFSWRLDTKDHFTFISPKVLEQLGYTPDEMFSKSFHDFLEQDEKMILKDKLSFFRNNKVRFWNMEHHFIKKNGEVVLLKINGVALYENKDLIGYEGICYSL